MITFRVDGEPKAQPRVKHALLNRKAGPATARPIIMVYTPKSANAWKSAVKAAARVALDGRKLDGALRVNLDFWFKRPKCHYGSRGGIPYLKGLAPKRWMTCKPDRDNLDKAFLDALTDAGIWQDDAFVVTGRISKCWSDDDSQGVDVEIEELEN